MWQQDVQEAKKRISLLLQNKKCEYALVLGQFLLELDSKIKGLDVNTQADPDQDVVQQLTIIRGYCYRFEDHQQSNYALGSAKHRLSAFYQSYKASTTLSISRRLWASEVQPKLISMGHPVSSCHVPVVRSRCSSIALPPSSQR